MRVVIVWSGWVGCGNVDVEVEVINISNRGLRAHYFGILKWDASNLSWKNNW